MLRLVLTKARFPFKRNRVRCVNENRKKRKRLRWQIFTQQTQASSRECSVEAVATMIGCLPTQALAFLAVFSLRNARNASDCV